MEPISWINVSWTFGLMGILIGLVTGDLHLTSNSRRSQYAPHTRHRRNVPRPDDLTPEQREKFVELHNYYRSREGAANMNYMRWDTRLAEIAQGWADACNFDHGVPENSSTPWGSMGQNIFVSSGSSFNIDSVMNAWFVEKNYFDFDTDTCDANKICGHYTQMIWYSSEYVGCGWSLCSSIIGATRVKSGLSLVCQYGPAGNFDRQPYIKGPACTLCETGLSWCRQNMCDEKCTESEADCECKPSCKNCGSAISNSTYCGCDCKPGWHGADCSLECKDTHKNCYNGWPKWACGHQTMGIFVREGCPLMCDLCTASDGSVCEDSTENIKTTTVQSSSSPPPVTTRESSSSYSSTSSTTLENIPTSSLDTSPVTTRSMAGTSGDRYETSPILTSLLDRGNQYTTRDTVSDTTTQRTDTGPSGSPSSPPPTPSPTGGSRLPTWAIGAIVIGGLVFLILMVVGIITSIRNTKLREDINHGHFAVMDKNASGSSAAPGQNGYKNSSPPEENGYYMKPSKDFTSL